MKCELCEFEGDGIKEMVNHLYDLHPDRAEAYAEGVRSTIPDDLPDGAYFAMHEEYGV